MNRKPFFLDVRSDAPSDPDIENLKLAIERLADPHDAETFDTLRYLVGGLFLFTLAPLVEEWTRRDPKTGDIDPADRERYLRAMNAALPDAVCGQFRSQLNLENGVLSVGVSPETFTQRTP